MSLNDFTRIIEECFDRPVRVTYHGGINYFKVVVNDIDVGEVAARSLDTWQVSDDLARRFGLACRSYFDTLKEYPSIHWRNDVLDLYF